MCDPLMQHRNIARATTPEENLSNLISSELGAKIDPKSLSLFIRLHWKRVSLYAHSIHDNGDK